MSAPVLTDGTTSVSLWQAQEDKAETTGDVDVTNAPAYDSEEVLLTGLTKQEEVSLSGTATGNRLSAMSEYSDDSVTALAEWVQLAMAMVNGSQGRGFDLTSTERDRTIPCVIGSFGWTREEGAPLEVQWDISLKRGEGVMGKKAVSPGEADPGGPMTLDGIDLQQPLDFREQKQQNFDPAPLTLADTPDDTVQAADSGAERRITITGKHSGSIAERKSFDDSIRALIGQDMVVEYRSPFPGHTIDVMVDSFESTRESGWTRLGEYSLELVEGVK